MTDWEMAERSAARRAVAWAEAELRNAIDNDPPEPSAAEIMLNLPPRLDATHCGHGRHVGDEPSEYAPVVTTWGPEDFSTCVCCEQTYLCIGTGFYTWGPRGESSSESRMDRHLCPECGGRVRREVHGICEYRL